MTLAWWEILAAGGAPVAMVLLMAWWDDKRGCPVRIERTAERAVIHLEEYGDLLQIRTLPDYRWVGASTVECDPADLELLGVEVVKTAQVDVALHLFDYMSLFDPEPVAS